MTLPPGMSSPPRWFTTSMARSAPSFWVSATAANGPVRGKSTPTFTVSCACATPVTLAVAKKAAIKLGNRRIQFPPLYIELPISKNANKSRRVAQEKSILFRPLHFLPRGHGVSIYKLSSFLMHTISFPHMASRFFILPLSVFLIFTISFPNTRERAFVITPRIRQDAPRGARLRRAETPPTGRSRVWCPSARMFVGNSPGGWTPKGARQGGPTARPGATCHSRRRARQLGDRKDNGRHPAPFRG